jgi:hypothetical protein
MALCALSCLKHKSSVVNFTNILRAAFAPIFLLKKVLTLHVSTNKLHIKLLYRYSARKALVKLTPGKKKRGGNILPNENLIMNFFIAAFFHRKMKVDLEAEKFWFPVFF